MNIVKLSCLDLVKLTGISNEFLERKISKDGYRSYCYARDVIKCRWKQGEESISKNKELVLYYAKNVLKARFELGEYQTETKSWYGGMYLFEFYIYYCNKILRYNHE